MPNESMSTATLNIETDELVSFREELAQLPISVKGDVLQAMGRGVQTKLIEHFGELDRDEVHHRWSQMLGAERTHFYASAAQGVSAPQIEGLDEVSVSITSEGILQRYFGGTITPKNAQWLTIPAIADAYGRRAASFNNLRFVLFRENLAALIEREATSARGANKGEKTGGEVVFWLKKEVTQAADETVLPTDDELAERAIEAGQEALGALTL